MYLRKFLFFARSFTFVLVFVCLSTALNTLLSSLSFCFRPVNVDNQNNTAANITTLRIKSEKGDKVIFVMPNV